MQSKVELATFFQLLQCLIAIQTMFIGSFFASEQSLLCFRTATGTMHATNTRSLNGEIFTLSATTF